MTFINFGEYIMHTSFCDKMKPHIYHSDELYLNFPPNTILHLQDVKCYIDLRFEEDFELIKEGT